MIWIGVYGDQNNINIVTSDRKKFTVKKTNYNLVGLKSFIEHLNEIKKRNYLAVARSSLGIEKRSRVALSLDRKLKFYEIRPIIYALAEANISNYEVETQVIR